MSAFSSLRCAVPRVLIVSCASLTLLPCLLRGQDTHYWNLSYGTQATLLGGAVIGSVSDLSATFYNPGMLAVRREQGLLLGANVYQFQRFSIDGIQGKSASSSRIGPSPGLVAGRVPVDSTVLGGVAYSILSRQYFGIDLKHFFTGQRDLLGPDKVPEDVATELSLTEDLNETWLGVTAFRLVRPGVGIGITTFVAVRNHAARSDVTANLLESSGSLVSMGRVRDFDYYNVRLLWKAGLGVDLGPLTLGLTITTPSLDLLGGGSAYFRSSYNGITAPGDTVSRQFLAADFQDDLSANYRSAWAIGAGAGYRIGNVILHLSAEWYAPVGQYDVLETSSFSGETDGETYSPSISQKLNSVFNLGLGTQIDLSESVSLYGSITTDRSAAPKDGTNTIAISAWDLYHFTAGTVLSLQPFDLTLGLSYASGSAPLNDVAWAQPGNEGGTPGRFIDAATLRTTSITGILAVTFRF